MGIQSFGAGMLGDVASSATSLGNTLSGVGSNLAKVVPSEVSIANTQIQNKTYSMGLQSDDFLQRLQMSNDFNSYDDQRKMFVDNLRSSIDSDSTLNSKARDYLINNYMPSIDEQLGYKVGILRDNGQWTATAVSANQYAQVLATDPTLVLDHAVAKYNDYYDKVGLGDVPSGFGILSVDDFKKGVMAPKALQSFSKDCIQNYGYDSQWNLNDAIERSISSIDGFAMNAVEKAQYVQDAIKIKDDRDKALDDHAAQVYTDINNDYGKAMLNDQLYSTDIIMDQIRSLPFDKTAKLTELYVSVTQNNDRLTYNALGKVIEAGGNLTDEYLAVFSEDSSYRKKIVVAQLEKQALAKFQASGDIRAAVDAIRSNASFSSSNDEQETAIKNVVAQAKEWMQGEKQYDDISLFIQENDSLFVETGRFVDSPVIKHSPEQPSAQPLTDKEPESQEHAQTDSEGTAVQEKGEGSPSVDIVPANADSNQQVNQSQFRPTLEISPSLGTTSGTNKATAKAAVPDKIAVVDDQITLSRLMDLRANGYPEEALKKFAWDAYSNTLLSEDSATKYSTALPFADNSKWANIMAACDSIAETYYPGDHLGKVSIKRKLNDYFTRVVAKNPEILNDDALFSSMMNEVGTIASDSYASNSLDKLQAFSKLSKEPSTYLKNLNNAKSGDVLESLANGSMMAFIDVNAQNRYLADDPTCQKNIDDMRDYFTQLLGFGMSYTEMVKMDLSKIQQVLVEYNCVYAQLRGTVGQLYQDTFKGIAGNSDIVTGAHMEWVGDSWAIRDQQNPNLYFIPDLKSFDNKGNGSWYYTYMDNDDNGRPIVSSMNGKRLINDIANGMQTVSANSAYKAQKFEADTNLINPDIEARTESALTLETSTTDVNPLVGSILMEGARTSFKMADVLQFLRSLVPGKNSAESNKQLNNQVNRVRGN